MPKISYYTHVGGLDTTQGYGYAGQNIVETLVKMGVDVPYNDPNSPIQLNFTQPYYFQLDRPEQYIIGYTPWESTKMHETWYQYMNQCDEVWTTNDFCAQMMADEGVTKPIHIYEHGIEKIWYPRERVQGSKIRFLHVGEPAVRKCGQMVYDAFHDVFGNNPDYELTIKANGYSSIRYDRDNFFGKPTERTSNVKIITEVLPIENLISLYHQHDVLVYPSYGEGFGFIPLQAIASGMPTILNEGWCSYKRFNVTPPVGDRLVDSPWPDVHPGQMLEPSVDDLKASMREVADNFGYYAGLAYAQAPRVHKEYSWRNVTRKAFNRLLKNS